MQRIRRAEDTAKEEERPVRDGEVDPACAQSCPTRAITFGDLEDPDSVVAQLFKSPRAELPLADLGTGPRVAYLKEGEWRGSVRARSQD